VACDATDQNFSPTLGSLRQTRGKPGRVGTVSAPPVRTFSAPPVRQVRPIGGAPDTERTSYSVAQLGSTLDSKCADNKEWRRGNRKVPHLESRLVSWPVAPSVEQL
jgi:hypothetical protein